MKPEAVIQWPALLAEKGLSLRAASMSLGLDASYLSVVVGRAKKKPGKLIIPSTDVITGLADLIGVSSTLLTDGEDPRDATDDKRSSLEEVIRWWHASGGRLEGCDKLKDSFDVIAVPGPYDKQITPLSVGSHSLAGKRIGPGLGPLGKALQNMPEAEALTLADGFRAQALADPRNISHSQRSMDVQKKSGVETTDFISVRLPCFSPEHGQVVVNYCFQ